MPWRRNVVWKKSSGEKYPRVSYKQQLLLTTKIDSLHLCSHYLNLWEEQNEAPWSLSLALYFYKFKVECRTSSLFGLPTAFRSKTCCKLKSSGRRLYCFISVPSSHQDKVGRKIQSSDYAALSFKPVVMWGWLGQQVHSFPPSRTRVAGIWGVGSGLGNTILETT